MVVMMVNGAVVGCTVPYTQKFSSAQLSTMLETISVSSLSAAHSCTLTLYTCSILPRQHCRQSATNVQGKSTPHPEFAYVGLSTIQWSFRKWENADTPRSRDPVVYVGEQGDQIDQSAPSQRSPPSSWASILAWDIPTEYSKRTWLILGRFTA